MEFESISEFSLHVGALYGDPFVNGDTINFPGTGFAVQATNGVIDLVNGRLDMTITAKPGTLIDSITFSEFGSYFLFGSEATVVSGAVAMLMVDGNNLFDDMTFSTSIPGNSAFADSMTVAFAPTDQVKLVYDSRLLAFAGIGSAAFIDKSLIQISVGTFTVIPEPSSLVTMALGAYIALVAGCRRRNPAKNFCRSPLIASQE